MNTCNTCNQVASAPWRVWDGDKIVLGCVDNFHTGHLVVPSASASWHAKGKAVRTSNRNFLRKGGRSR